MKNLPNGSEDEVNVITFAVMFGKIEERLSQVLDALKQFDEVWERLRRVENEQARQCEFLKAIENERARRPSWTTVVSVIIALISLALAAGVIGEKGL